MTGICVKTNGHFTLLDDYEINFHSDGEITVESDDGCQWFVSYQGDGYYGCRDSNGKEVSFLVE
ncbi:hypothetical protein Sd1_gp9 [Shigella phage Sd1]|uniref:Uncharacterized protein n=1 Tax=Shigella phage Sd1 TaxID=2024313 RepID=A0A291AYI5_9CAUD|nr:hypothetical protein HOR98_gp08 [Shigella phage Sd1]ATE86075.1 hypothetical protein Sd1_gp9 [Shigella phage Sd1]